MIFSHRFSLSAAWYSTLAEHHASCGFIVLATEHTEQFDPELSDMWKAVIDRPGDVKQTLDYAEELPASGSDMAGPTDMEHVAVLGHSYGEYTPLCGYRWQVAREDCQTTLKSYMPSSAGQRERQRLQCRAVSDAARSNDPQLGHRHSSAPTSGGPALSAWAR